MYVIGNGEEQKNDLFLRFSEIDRYLIGFERDLDQYFRF